jgi:hypothetical protein
MLKLHRFLTGSMVTKLLVNADMRNSAPITCAHWDLKSVSIVLSPGIHPSRLVFIGLRKVCCLVEAHVVAKRSYSIVQSRETNLLTVKCSYLCGTSEEYHAALSSASKKSLVMQGGAFSSEEAEQFRSDPLWKEKVQVRWRF